VARNQNWPGATPFGWPLARPNARPGFGVAPGQFLPHLTTNSTRTNMPLLDRPKSETPKRKYRAAIDEPIAITTQKHTELLQADSVDHLIVKALDFVFRKDADSKIQLANSWGPAPSTPGEDKRPKPAGCHTETSIELPTEKLGRNEVF
jgi:hypothetical protein